MRKLSNCLWIIGSILCVAFWGLSCTADQAATVTKDLSVAAEIGSALPVPSASVVGEAASSWMASASARFQALAKANEELRAAGDKPKNMSLGEILFGLTGVVSGLGAAVTSKMADSKKDNQLANFATGVAQAIGAMKQGAGVLQVASILTNALPGELAVDHTALVSGDASPKA